MGNQVLFLMPQGGWNLGGYEPSKIRITCNPDPTADCTVQLGYHTGGLKTLKGYGSGLVSGTEFDLQSSWYDGGDYISGFYIETNGDYAFDILNIEFYG